MDRRKFLGFMSVGTLATSLPMILAACGSNSNQTQTTTSTTSTPTSTPTSSAPKIREDGFLEVGTVEELAQNKSILKKKEDIIVIRGEDDSLKAFNPLCTHRQCTVEWQEDNNNFICDCHGSKFASDGSVTNAPAKKPLSSYEVKEEEGKILVKI